MIDASILFPSESELGYFERHHPNVKLFEAMMSLSGSSRQVRWLAGYHGHHP